MLYELEQVVNKVFNDYTFPKVRTVGYINGYNHYEKDGSIFIEINAAGFDKKDMEISINDGLLNIKADSGDKDESSITSGGLNKVVKLPNYADIDNITAASKNGVLTVQVPLEKSKKKIKIK